MAQNYLVSIILTAKDTASGVFAKVENASTGALGRVSAWTAKNTATMNTLGNQTTIAGASIVGALGAMAYKAGVFADDMEELSQKTGIASDRLQFMKFAAEQTGGSLQGLVTANKFLQKNMVQNEDAFAKWGITVRDSSGKLLDSQTVMENVAEKMKALDDPAQRTALSMELMGRSGTEMVPLLMNGKAGLDQLKASFEATGGAVDTAKFAEFNDKLVASKQAAMNLMVTLGGILIPSIQWLTTTVQNAAAWVGDFSTKHETLSKAILVATGVVGGLLLTFGLVAKAMVFYQGVLTAITSLKELYTVATGKQAMADLAAGEAATVSGKASLASGMATRSSLLMTGLAVAGVGVAVVETIDAVQSAVLGFGSTMESIQSGKMSATEALKQGGSMGTLGNLLRGKFGAAYKSLAGGAAGAWSLATGGPNTEELAAQELDPKKALDQLSKDLKRSMASPTAGAGGLGASPGMAGLGAPLAGVAMAAPAQPLQLQIMLDRGLLLANTEELARRRDWQLQVGYAQ